MGTYFPETTNIFALYRHKTHPDREDEAIHSPLRLTTPKEHRPMSVQ